MGAASNRWKSWRRTRGSRSTAKVYTIATNNFVRQGGDGYKLFAANAQNAYDYGPGLEQVVADYLTAHRPYTPKLDGRITEIAATVAAAPADAAKPAEPAASAATAAAPTASSEHVIEAGDNYWKIAEKIYGDGMKWKAISEANPEYRPRRLPIGGTLKIPPAG